MDISFYNGAIGAKAQQNRMDIIANNMSNLQTEGYKAQTAGFADLLYSNMDAQPPTNGDLTVGSGTRVEKTDINFEAGSMIRTDGNFDYAIGGDGYFALYNIEEQRIAYTRNGSFHMAQVGTENTFYLAAQNGDFVLDKNMQLIPVDSGDQQLDIGVFDFDNKEGVQLQGNNIFTTVDKNGQPRYNPDATVQRGYLESSNVDLSYEMSKLIETQRAYQMSVRMIKTADEIEETINGLRQG